MQRCQNCNMSFNWREIYKSFLHMEYKPIVCDNCGTKHKINNSGRWTFVSLTILPAMLFSNFLSPFNNIFATLIVGLSILMIGSFVHTIFC
ncbi:TIGR04104 family putative zinc finger protein [Lentibacillus amyloliquefaciens]|uniref:TIGR04104 family putative zinc finger protein n=1 Tax=Lentibacillus amyloliquefaciens TaxID=1472767 RepID=UPI003AAE8C2A